MKVTYEELQTYPTGVKIKVDNKTYWLLLATNDGSASVFDGKHFCIVDMKDKEIQVIDGVEKETLEKIEATKRGYELQGQLK